MNNFSMIRILNMILKSYEIIYIFVTPSPPSYETLSNKWKCRSFWTAPKNLHVPRKVKGYLSVLHD